MKVVSSKQMAHIESLAYRDGASESDFMEEAGSGVALVVHDYVEKHQLDRYVLLLCGKGNNAGDAYVAGIHLLHLEYDVFAIQIVPIEECSPLCKENHRRFLTEGGRSKEINTIEDIAFPLNGIIIDGIFGTGFHGKVSAPYAPVIHAANQSKLPIIAVDIPSGLNGETGAVEGEAIIAEETAFLGLPKTGFFLMDGWNHVGKLRYVDFGLAHQYIEESDCDFIMLSPDILKPMLPPIVRNRNKYSRGFVAGLGGNPGMPGAPIMSSTAALKGGAGIVKLLHPKGMDAELALSPVELVRIPYDPSDTQTVIDALNKATATFVGPGIGRQPSTKELLRKVLPELKKPCVIDADALTILSEEDIQLPEQSILTPHMGEFLRLIHKNGPLPLDKELLHICQEYAESKRVTLVLKGGPTFIFQADEPIHVNPSGDPGMATAGSGDILTGLLAALLSQGMTPHKAACLGVYIHGLAGEHAAREMTSYSVTATDILFYFPEGFRFLEL